MHILRTLAGVAFLGLCLFMPGHYAQAQTPTVSQCNPSEIAGFVPYTYDGKLHSFDYFYNGLPGTVLKTVVGGIEIQPSYVSVWRVGTTTQKIHVDVPGWYSFSGNTTIAVEVLSRSGCTNKQVFTVVLPTAPVVQGPTKHTVTTTSAAVASHNATAQAPATQTPEPISKASMDLEILCGSSSAQLRWSSEQGNLDEILVERAAAGSSFERLHSASSLEQTYTDMAVHENTSYTYRVVGLEEGRAVITSPTKTCTLAGVGSLQETGQRTGKCGWAASWWSVLLVAQILSSLLIISVLAALLQGNGWRFTLALFAPFALLLGMWFAFDSCRENQWFPIMVTLVTLATLFAPTFLKGHTDGTREA